MLAILGAALLHCWCRLREESADVTSDRSRCEDLPFLASVEVSQRLDALPQRIPAHESPPVARAAVSYPSKAKCSPQIMAYNGPST